MRFEDINPFVRQALVAKLTSNNRDDVFNRIKSVDSRLFYILDGVGTMRFDGCAYPLSAGTLVIFKAGTPYVWEVEEIDYCAVNFDYSRSFSHLKEGFHPISAEEFSESDITESPNFEDEPILNKPLVLSSGAVFEKDVKKIVTEFLLGGEYSEAINSALLKLLISEAVRRAKSSELSESEKVNDSVKRLIEYVSKNYSKDITYETIEKEFRFNPSYLNRIFKEYTGVSIHNFILQYRMNIAMENLRTQNLYINQVAALSGFRNPYHFTKAFTKYVGISPTEYKNGGRGKKWDSEE